MLRFKTSSCVVIGTFNIYIVQPRWLADIGVFEHGDKVAIRSDLQKPGFQLRHLEDSRKTWIVRPDRVDLNSVSPRDDCGQPLAAVLGHLQWTPLTAVGINAVFSSAQVGPLAHLFQPESLPGDHQAVQSMWHRAILNDRGDVVNTNVSRDASGAIQLAINVHSEMSRQEGETDQDVSGRAVKACSEFLQRRQEAIELASYILNVELDDGDDDDVGVDALNVPGER
jgi:hypothetical protein